MTVIKGDNFLIKNWATNLEQGAIEQATNAAKMPCIFRHVAVMPDGHQGMGFPIGGVMALKNAICPNAIGVDEGCGMRTCKTSIKSEVISDMRIRRDWLNRAKTKIPIGEGNGHRENQTWDCFEESPFEITERDRKNLGSLGGGNHFSSLEQTQDGYVQLLLHSGSRNLGHRICTKYSKIAEELCTRWFVKLEDIGLSFLPIGEPITDEFIKCLNFALDYARENRRRMMIAMQVALLETLLAHGLGDVEFSDEHDVHHNYATLESHFGKNVWVHRKGATSAKKGEICIIPGSMGTASYLCEGLGNPESFMSCSHGAGRKMSRTAASERLTKEECDKAMEGIVCDRWSTMRRGKAAGKLDLSEAPGAYKDIEEVIANEADLVKPIVRLTPLAVLKG
ncbi:MAG: RtcB family protein [Prevotella sp.]|nr:RtcB family protein [Prevotella sp.]